MAKTALAIAAHPDDIEFLMAGTLLRLRDAGYAIHYWNLANGSCGTQQYDRETIIRIRRNEAMAAAEYLGATYHESICDDLAIFYDQPTLAQVASVVRKVAPDVLLTHSPSDYMEDHVNACRLAVTGAFARSMPNFPVDPPRDFISKPVTVYHAQPYSNRDPLREMVRPELYVDVTELLEQKKEALAKHVSQKSWLDESQGQDSYLQTLEDLQAEVGQMSGQFRFAEGWRRHLHVGFCQETDDPLRDSLKTHVHCIASYRE